MKVKEKIQCDEDPHENYKLFKVIHVEDAWQMNPESSLLLGILQQDFLIILHADTAIELVANAFLLRAHHQKRSCPF